MMQLMKQDIQCGLYKFCESTSGFCDYSKVRRILGFLFKCQRLYSIRASTILSSAIIFLHLNANKLYIKMKSRRSYLMTGQLNSIFCSGSGHQNSSADEPCNTVRV